MREIKFRAWDTEDKVMRSWKELTLEKDRGDSTWFIGYPASKVVTKFDHKQELMQYTGLKDKNGTEIYEGDILTSHCYPFQDDGRYNYHGLVEWFDDHGSFYITKQLVNRKKMGLSDGISESIENTGRFEVIGNIYEHPELLEVD